MNVFDVIIVGAGPSGAIAGFHLARAGLDVLLLEKCTFPRRKVCGGGLTQRARKEIPFDITPVIHDNVNWGYVGFRGRKIGRIYSDDTVATLIERGTFDAFLLQKTINEGAVCLQDQRVIRIKETKGEIKVQTQDEEFHSRYLVGADGVNSLTARQLGLIRTRKTSLVYEARLSLPDHAIPPLIQSITFDFGTVLSGYGWIFPKRDHLNVGVFRSWPGHKTSKQQLMRFINQHPVLRDLSLIDIRAQPGPQGGDKEILHKGRALLTGDSANLADPWLGEGLYYALASGRMAAESILAHTAGLGEDLSDYTRSVNDTLVSQFAYAKKLAILVNLFPLINVHMLAASPILQNMVMDLLRGKRSYQQIWCDLKRRFPKIIHDILKR